MIKRCQDCGLAHFYPRPFCPSCWSERLDWEQASGLARLYTYSIVYVNDLPPFGDRVPYVAALVDLAEGPRLMSNVVECRHEDLQIGMPLSLVLIPFGHDAEGKARLTFAFEPASGAGHA